MSSRSGYSLKRSYHVSSESGSSKRAKSTQKTMGLTTPMYKRVNALVKKRSMDLLEKKKWILYAANQPIAVSNGGAVFPFQSCLTPQVTQGTGDGLRIGNKLKVLSADLNICVNLLPYNATTNPLPTPIWARILVMDYKKQKTNNIANTDIQTALFTVNAGTVGPQGTPLDMTLEVNNESWSVYHDEVFRLGSTAPSSTGPVSSGSYFDNTQMSVRKSIQLKPTGTYMYNDATVVPTNKSCWLVILTCSADGQNSASYFLSECHYTATWRYVDA